MKHSIYILFLFVCIASNAQTNVLQRIPDIDSTFSAELTGEFFFESKQYIGEQYFNNDWWDGDVLLSSGQRVNGKLLKYNGLFDELIWLNNSNYGKFKLDKLSVDEFWMRKKTGDTIHFKRINVGDTTSIHRMGIYTEVMVTGTLSLCIQRKISAVGYEDEYKNKVLGRYYNLKSKPLYYIKLPENQYLLINKLSNTSFLKLFPDKKDALSKIIRDNHFNAKNENEFVKLIELINREGVF